MELLYVWINKHKCIHKQGFCLSPEFEIYMKAGEQGNYQLTIEYLGNENIFKDAPIENITVIVGENGSGKTTFLQYLQLLNCFPENIFQENNQKFNEVSKKRVEESKNIIIIRDKTKIQIYTNIKKEQLEVESKNILFEKLEGFYFSDNEESASKCVKNSEGFYGMTTIYLTNSSYTMKDGMGAHGKLQHLFLSPGRLSVLTQMFYRCIYARNVTSQFSDPFLCYSYYLKQSKDSGNFQQLCDVLFYHRLIQTNAIQDYAGFVPTDLTIKFLTSKQIINEIKNNNPDMIKKDAESIEKRWESLLKYYDFTMVKQSLLYCLSFNLLAEYFLLYDEDDEMKEAATIKEKYRVLKYKIDKLDDDEYGRYFRQAYKEIQKFQPLLSQLEPSKNIVPIEDMSYKMEFHMTIKLEEEKKQESTYAKVCEFLADVVRENAKLQNNKNEFGSFILRYICIGNLSFSSGERAFQNLMSWMSFLADLPMLSSETEYVPRKNILLCIDEIDLYCHPSWQRDFIDNLISLVKKAYEDYTVQMILTTHSPLCLSDVPKENIIYLTKKNSKTEVDMNTKNHRQTFGCNLYELLNDSFYLSNQTMGKFACRYIDRCICEINQVNQYSEKDWERWRKQISYIGDILIRKKLEQQLERKFQELVNTEEQKILKLEVDKARIEKQIEELRNKERLS